MQDYYQLAISLREGKGFNSLIRAPLYPYLISLLFAICHSTNLILIKWFQSSLSLLNGVLIYSLGNKLFDARTGLLSAWIFTFYPTLLFFNNFILAETVFLFLISCFFLAFVLFVTQKRKCYLIVASLFLGLSTLCRSVVIYLPALIIFYILLILQGTLSEKLKSALIFSVCFILVITPWTIRNYKVHHAFIPIDIIGKINVILGNYEYTPLNRAWDAHITQTGERSWSFPLSQERRYDHMTEAQKADWAFYEGLKFIKKNPVLTLKRDFIKLCDFWELERVPLAMLLKGFLGDSHKLILGAFAVTGWIFYSIILFGTIFALIYFFKNNLPVNIFFLFVISYFTLIHAIIYGHPRYHLPLVPILVIYSSQVLVNIKMIWNSKGSPKFIFACFLCLFFLFTWVREVYIHINNLYLV